MDIEKIIELLSYTIPSVVTGFVAYYFFVNHTKNEERKLQLSVLKENQKQSLPLKLQAYEGMTLFLERINPSKLLLRINSVNNDKYAYAQSVINTIEQEFEHNLTQQIYLSDECWSVIIAAKNATIHLINKTSESESVKDAEVLRESVLKNVLNNGLPSTAALSFIKNEIKDIL